MDTGEHLNPSDEISLETVKSRAVRGVVLLTGRTFFLSVLSLVATGFLTVFLEPSEFGIFWLVVAVINFLSYFSDIGLAAALIQKKEIPTREDLKTTFTVQQLLILLILVVLGLASPWLIRYYHLSREGIWLLTALAGSLVISSLKTIPSVLIERKLQFEKLVIPQILENLVYSLVAVYLAWKGFGITSFTVAILVRGFTGLVAIYILMPWVPGLALSRKSLRGLLTYGVPYQANSFLATIKDDGMTMVLGGILGPTGIGLLGWAQKWGQAPLRFFMDHVIKVTFPAFARMQGEKETLKHSLERSLFFIALLVFPSLAGLLVVAPVLVAIIPRYAKWIPALVPLYLIGVNTLMAAVTTPLTNLLSAVGRIKTTFKLMVMWTGLTWLLIPFLALKLGVNGAALGYSLVSLSSVVAMVIVGHYLHFSFRNSIIKPLVASIIMMGLLLILRLYLPVSLTAVFVLIGFGVAIYGSVVYLLVGVSLGSDLKKSWTTFFPGNKLGSE